MAEQVSLWDFVDEETEIAVIKLDYEDSEIIPNDLEGIDWNDNNFDDFKIETFGCEYLAAASNSQTVDNTEKKTTSI